MANELLDRLDAVVVGAGYAGLRAATLLADAGVSVGVVEARDRVGGRTWSKPIGSGVFDLGGQWMGPGQERLAAMATRYGVQTFPTFHQGNKVLDLGGKLRTYKSSIPSLGPLSLIDLQLVLWRTRRAASRVPLHNPAAARRAGRLDAMSVETWARANIHTRDVRRLLEVATRVIFGAEPSELSLLYFLFYLRSGGGLMNLIEIERGCQQDRFVPGAQQIAIEMAQQLGDSVVLDAPVVRIAQDGDGVAVETARGTVRAGRVIVAVPPNLAGRICYEPGLPALRDQLTQRVPMGSTVKVIVTYSRPFWRRKGFSGEAVCSKGPISVVFDNTSHDNAQPALLAFLVGRGAREFEGQSDIERRRVVLDTLARYFGDEARKPEAVVEQNWSAETYTRGCPVGVIAPGVLTTFATNLRRPVGRIHFAGTETATVFNGYLEGALESGERAASEVLRELGASVESAETRAVS